MKIIIAPDSFKSSLSAVGVADALARGIFSAMPGAEIVRLPMADGGEGTVDALVTATGGTKVTITTKDPLMRAIEASYGFVDEYTAVVEMAAASGLERLRREELNPLKTSSYGTGVLIRDAISKGATKIIAGLGGSATNDGGTGMAQALGAIFKDAEGNEVEGNGGSLHKLNHVDLSALKKQTRGVEFITAVDVANPLLGKNGATYVYSGQKGADAGMKKTLEHNLTHFADVMEEVTGKSFRNIAGAGAAGGMAAGLICFLEAQTRSGFSLISELTQLEEYIREADLVITGEGKLDDQTPYGKTPYGVAQLAKKHHKPVVAFAGALANGYLKMLDNPFDNFYPIADRPMSLEQALEEAPELLERAAARMIRSIKLMGT